MDRKIDISVITVPFLASLMSMGMLRAQQPQTPPAVAASAATPSPAPDASGSDSCGAGLAGTPTRILSDNVVKGAHNAADAAQIRDSVSDAHGAINAAKIEHQEGGLAGNVAALGQVFSAKDDIKSAHDFMDRIKNRKKPKAAPVSAPSTAAPCTTTHFLFHPDAKNAGKATLVLSSNANHIINLDQIPGNANLYRDEAGNTFLIAEKTDRDAAKVTVIPAAAAATAVAGK